MHKCHDDVKGLSCLRSRNCRSATYSGSAEDRYRRAVAACRQLGLPLTICTIYNGCFPDAEDLDHCKLAVLNSLGSSACAAFTNTPSINSLPGTAPNPRTPIGLEPDRSGSLPHAPGIKGTGSKYHQPATRGSSRFSANPAHPGFVALLDNLNLRIACVCKEYAMFVDV
jgi:hypothetical protein